MKLYRVQHCPSCVIDYSLVFAAGPKSARSALWRYRKQCGLMGTTDILSVQEPAISAEGVVEEWKTVWEKARSVWEKARS